MVVEVVTVGTNNRIHPSSKLNKSERTIRTLSDDESVSSYDDLSAGDDGYEYDELGGDDDGPIENIRQRLEGMALLEQYESVEPTAGSTCSFRVFDCDLSVDSLLLYGRRCSRYAQQKRVSQREHEFLEDLNVRPSPVSDARCHPTAMHERNNGFSATLDQRWPIQIGSDARPSKR